jgi:hypothetical protein
MIEPKVSVFPIPPIRENQSTETLFWPPRVVWARERGWLNIQDPYDGSWFSIPAKGAPYGYVRLAMNAQLLRGRT